MHNLITDDQYAYTPSAPSVTDTKRKPVTESEFRDIFSSLDGFIPDSRQPEAPPRHVQISVQSTRTYSGTYSAPRSGIARFYFALCLPL